LREGTVPLTHHGQQVWHYEIRVHGHLGETFRAAFPGLRARIDGQDTVLSGVLADRAALYGVLAEFETLGLELIELRRLPAQEPPGATRHKS
jgi:hypothetical protein